MRKLFLLWLVPLVALGCHARSSPQPVKGEAERSESQPAPVSLAVARAAPPTSPPLVVPRFTDVAQASGVEFVYFNDEVPDRFFLPEVNGGGLAWLDFDGDGLLDLLAANGAVLENPQPHQRQHLDRLWRNLGNGRFQDVTLTAAAHDGGFGQGCAAADFDADGFTDVLLTNYDRTHRRATVLLHNQGDGTFVDCTQVAGLQDHMWGTSAAWADLNDDGLLDFYAVSYMDVPPDDRQVCSYSGVRGYCGPGEYGGELDRVYVNEGTGRFVESAQGLGLDTPARSGLAISVIDLDHDLRPEVYVANDMTFNYLFTRSTTPQGSPAEGRYLEIARQVGCAVADDGQAEASMGIACADFDGDQWADIFLTHYYQRKNTLYRNLGDLLFKDESRRSRVAALGHNFNGFGTLAIDYDRDGASDLFATNGHVLGPNYTPNAMRAQLLHNDGRGRFADASSEAGAYFQEQFYGRCAAGADYDQDGDLDIAVSHLHRPLALLRNDTAAAGHFLGLDLRTLNRVPPIGGRVVVTAGSRRWTYPISSGGSYLASSDPRLLLAVPAGAEDVRVTIYWPSGEVDEHTGLALDEYYRAMPGERPVLLAALTTGAGP